MFEFKTVTELLQEASRWCKGALARDAWGHACYPRDPAACSFCLFGALERVYGSAMKPALVAIVNNIPSHHTIGEFNDDPAITHADVLKLVRDLGL